MRKILRVLVSITIIILTFILPSVLFKVEDMQSDKRIYSQNKLESKIDVQAQKIYLVKMLHEIEGGHLSIEANNMYGVSKIGKDKPNEYTKQEEIVLKAIEEMKNLKENNIITQNIINNEQEISKYEIQRRNYSNAKNEYSITQMYFQMNDEKRVNLEIEGRTGKIMLYGGVINELEGLEDREILENYVKYLGLNIIDDWRYEGNLLKSEKAKLVVVLLYYENSFYLSIHSEKLINQNLDEK